MKRSHWLLLVLGMLTLVLDQGTKYWAATRLTSALSASTGPARVMDFLRQRKLESQSRPGRVHALGEGTWRFRYVENAGAAWGVWADLPERVRRPAFLLVSLLALGFISFMVWKWDPPQRAVQVALGFVLGGAVGNLFDRMVHGYIIDFIDWQFAGPAGPRWPTFNLADAALGLGAAMLLCDLLRGRWTLAGTGKHGARDPSLAS